MKLQPGQFYRNTDTLGCIQRIKVHQPPWYSALEVALVRELDSKRPRKKLIAALEKRIQEISNP